jgi:hypothetical protein
MCTFHMLPFPSLQVLLPTGAQVTRTGLTQARKLSTRKSLGQRRHSYVALGCYFNLVFSPHNFSSLRFFKRGFFPWICWPHVLNKLCFQLADPSVPMPMHLLTSLYLAQFCSNCCSCVSAGPSHVLFVSFVCRVSDCWFFFLFLSLFIAPQFPNLS